MYSDFRAQENKSVTLLPSPLLFAMKSWNQISWFSFAFLKLILKPAFLLPSFNLIKRLSSSSLLSAIRVVPSAYMILFHIEMIPAMGPITITRVWFLPYDFHLQQSNKMSKLVRQMGKDYEQAN